MAVRYRMGALLQRSRRIFTRKRVLAASIVLFIVILTIPVLTYAYFARDISDRERLMNRNNTGFALLDRNGEVFYSHGHVLSEDDVSLHEVSDNFEKALLASEDQEFYNHQGYSLRGMVRAMYANVINKDLTRYGGSTITQQLVKNNL